MPQTDIKLTLNQGYCSKSISRMPPEEGNVVLGWFQTSGPLRIWTMFYSSNPRFTTNTMVKLWLV